MSGRRQQLEKKVQRDIELALGAEPDLLLLKNSVGQARFVDAEGKEFFVPYGLGKGSPDLVGLLRISVVAPVDRLVSIWFCLEVKAEGGVLSPDQEKTHAIWRRFGAFVDTVRSVGEARAALDRARRLES